MKHVREDLPDVQIRRPEVSAALAAVLDRATAKELDRRYPDAATLIADLEDVLAIETSRSGQVTGEATAVLRSLPANTRRKLPLRTRRSTKTIASLIVADRRDRGRRHGRAGAAPDRARHRQARRDRHAAGRPAGDRPRPARGARLRPARRQGRAHRRDERRRRRRPVVVVVHRGLLQRRAAEGRASASSSTPRRASPRASSSCARRPRASRRRSTSRRARRPTPRRPTAGRPSARRARSRPARSSTSTPPARASAATSSGSRSSRRRPSARRSRRSCSTADAERRGSRQGVMSLRAGSSVRKRLASRVRSARSVTAACAPM